MKALIIAGGHGTRLWPLSRANKPKQLQPILSGRSLLQETADRLTGLVSPEDTFVIVTDAFQLEAVRAQLPHLPADNILQEPSQKNTAAAIAFGTAELIRRGYANDIVAVLYADLAIENKEKLHESLRHGERFIRKHPDHLMMIGVTPSYPETGYGYIERGEPLEEGVYEVFGFREKPNRELAAEFVAGGQHLWNIGIFLWRVGTMAERLTLFSPPHVAILNAENSQELANAYARVPNTAIDYLLFEHDDRLAVIPTDLKWRDIGHWESLREHYRHNGQVVTLRGTHVGVDSRDCLVVSDTDRLIATVGLENIVIVDTPDVLLVCRADQAQKIRELTDELRRDETTSALL